MQENTNEGNLKKDATIITIGTEFTPFRKLPLNKIYTLIINENLKIPIRVGLILQGKGSKAENITPFLREEGYAVSDEDLELESRKKKIKDLQKTHIDPQKAPFLLFVDVDEYELNRWRVNEKASSENDSFRKYDFPQETLELLQMLKLQVRAGGRSYESKPEIVALEDGALLFREFYPLDAGPLASNPKDDLKKVGIMFVDRGNNLLLPASPKQLATIKMKFVLTEDTPAEAAEKKADRPL